MKPKTIFSLLIILLISIPSASALSGTSYLNGKYHLYSEICLQPAPPCADWNIICKIMDALKISRVRPKCDINTIQVCNQNQPRNYECATDLERQCFRDCWSYNLTFDHYSWRVFDADECWCLKDNLPFNFVSKESPSSNSAEFRGGGIAHEVEAYDYGKRSIVGGA